MRRADFSEKRRTQRVDAHRRAKNTFTSLLSQMSHKRNLRDNEPSKKRQHRLADSNDDRELAEIMDSLAPGMRVQPLQPDSGASEASSVNTTNDSWCYTLLNYTKEEEEKMIAFHHVCKQVKYHIFGREVAGTGTPHLQGFVVFTSRKKFNTVKNLISDRGTN